MNHSDLSGRKLAACALLLIGALASVARCQVSDGDDQFQAYHQDIGRITSASSSPVAPETIVRQPLVAAEQPEPVAAPVPVLAPARATPILPAARAPSGRQSFAGPKRNRITLAVPRREQEPLLAPAVVEPALQPTTLIEPSQEAPSQLIAPPPQRLAQPAQYQYQPAAAAVVAQPSSSVSPRHAALMAQVAAERQAETGHQQQQHHHHHHQARLHQAAQPSLGSPIEALSSPAVAQVQAPPTLAAFQQVAPASPALTFVNQPEEPIVAPSFEHVLSRGCPGKGVFSYENKDHCDRYYMCTNGTFTEEACPNGLAYSQMGAVYQHCAYNWNVDCGRKKTAEPLASPGCPWQFGIFPIAAAGRCSIDYFVCEWGVPETKRCSPEGLFYDDRIKGCQWADQLGCKSEALLNFKCPPEDEDNPYWPYPRYYHTNRDIIVCVNEQPRLVHCNEDQLVDGSSLACVDLKKKKKPFKA